MYYYVYLHPDVLAEAQRDGELAQNLLISILRNFLQDCFLTVFEDDRWSQEVKDILETWSSNMTKTKIQSILTIFKKRNRMLFNIKPDYLSEKTDLKCVFDQVSNIEIDLLVIDEANHRDSMDGLEVSTIKSYYHSKFVDKRSTSENGKTCELGKMDQVSFLETHFKKGIKYAKKIHICDRLVGSKNLSDNFLYTIKIFFAWLGSILYDPDNCEIIFHTGQPKGVGAHHIEHEMKYYKTKYLSKTKISVYLYEKLPHQRFFLTNQIAMDIDRGMDFFDKNTKKCRDTRITYREVEDAEKLLNTYSNFKDSKCLTI